MAESAAQRTVAIELVSALREREHDLGIKESTARSANLEALAAASRQGGVAAVVTGQQVGLFLGPLYTFYKAASAIACARAIECEFGIRSVPIFWLQTEDHDYEEINHCLIPKSDAPPLCLELAPRPDEARTSVAHRVLGDEILAQLAALKETLAGLPHADAFLSLLRTHYRPDATLGAAFAGVLAEIFSDEGLVLLDPRPWPRSYPQAGAVARLARPIYRQVLLRHEEISAALNERTLALRAAGFAEQVHVRKETSLLFCHRGGETGPRYRLERQHVGWALSGHAYSDEEVLNLLESEPVSFSTSALLRPLVQDALLPTVAYIGGPGEINYLAQIGPLYGLLNVPQPLVMPRARFRCVDERTRSLLAKLGPSLPLAAADVEVPRQELLFRIAEQTAKDLPSPDALRAGLSGAFHERLEEVRALDVCLDDAIERTRKSVDRNIERLVQRYSRMRGERDQVAAERVDRLQRFLFPQNMPQERFYSLPYFACKYGLRTLKEKVLGALSKDPFSVFSQGTCEIDL